MLRISNHLAVLELLLPCHCNTQPLLRRDDVVQTGSVSALYDLNPVDPFDEGAVFRAVIAADRRGGDSMPNYRPCRSGAQRLFLFQGAGEVVERGPRLGLLLTGEIDATLRQVGPRLNGKLECFVW